MSEEKITSQRLEYAGVGEAERVIAAEKGRIKARRQRYEDITYTDEGASEDLVALSLSGERNARREVPQGQGTPSISSKWVIM